MVAATCPRYRNPATRPAIAIEQLSRTVAYQVAVDLSVDHSIQTIGESHKRGIPRISCHGSRPNRSRCDARGTGGAVRSVSNWRAIGPPMIHIVRGIGLILRALPDFARTTAFRWTPPAASTFVLCMLLLFSFVYWQTAVYLMSENDVLLTEELRVFAANTPQQRLAEIDDRLRKDPRRIKIAGLFGADGHRIVGNIESLPGGLTPDIPAVAVVVRVEGGDRENQKVKLAAHPLPSGELLVIGRNIDEIAKIAEIVGRALALGLLPAFGLAVATAMVLRSRAHDRLL